MVSFCIKCNNLNIIDYLFNQLSLVNLENIYFSKKKFSKFHNIIIHYKGKGNVSQFYNEIANLICNCILLFYEPIIIKKMLYQNYFYFDQLDLNKIENICSQTLFQDRKTYLWTDILKYITSNKSMNLDGIVNFRISNYLKCIDTTIDNSVSQFVVDKEYSDFISLLRLYISSKPCRSEIIHLIYINGESILLDKNKNLISINNATLNTNYLSDISFSLNDYALNTLLTLLPQKLIIHLITQEDEFIETLKLIFEESIQICTDCSICKTYKILNVKEQIGKPII